MKQSKPSSTTFSTKGRGRPPGPQLPLAERFWRLVERRSPDECWNWTGSGYGEGYGGFSIYRRGCVGAHRVAYELTHGPQPKSVFILHRCDNRRCCNPAHLFLGDHAANMEDMAAKGRSVARLRPEEAIAARALHQHYGWNAAKLAKRFGVTRGAICDLLARKTYRQVGPDLTRKFLEGSD